MAIKEKAKKFNNELRKNLSTALVAAFSFVIALAWRDLIAEQLNQITSLSPLQGKLFSAIIITIVGVIGILLITSFLSKKE